MELGAHCVAFLDIVELFDNRRHAPCDQSNLIYPTGYAGDLFSVFLSRSDMAANPSGVNKELE